MKKVMVIVGSLNIGGQEKISIDLVRSLKGDFQIYFVVYGEQVTHYENTLESKNISVLHIPYRQYHYYEYYLNLKKIVKEYGQFDILHCHGMFNIGINMVIGYLLKIPKRIAHCHSTNNGRKSQTIVTILYEHFSRFLINKFSTNLLACGKQSGQYLYGKKIFDQKVRVIPNGIDYHNFRFNNLTRMNMREKLGINMDCKVYGIVARLTPLKNHFLLIDIFKQILQKEPESLLLIIGDGEIREDIERKLKENNMMSHILMLGNRDNVSDFLSCMDFFVLPSKYEGFPISIVEAQVNGLICFISDGINSEINISGNVHQFKLNSSIYEIADFMLSFNCNTEREMILDKIPSDYDIRNSQKLIESIYES